MSPRAGRARSSAAPRAVALSEALEDSVALGHLLAQARLSRACLAAARPELGAALASQLRGGPIDDTTWTVLADNGQAAAKARQLAPNLLDIARTQGMAVTEVKIKVSPRSASD